MISLSVRFNTIEIMHHFMILLVFCIITALHWRSCKRLCQPYKSSTDWVLECFGTAIISKGEMWDRMKMGVGVGGHLFAVLPWLFLLAWGYGPEHVGRLDVLPVPLRLLIFIIRFLILLIVVFHIRVVGRGGDRGRGRGGHGLGLGVKREPSSLSVVF